MNSNGRAGVVLPHGVLFRGGSEGRIREQILRNDLIEAVIALPPKLFYGTGIPAAILIFNKNKPKEREGKVLIIDAEKDFSEGKNQNTLRYQDIQNIVKAYDNYKDVEGYARVVDTKDIETNEYNLNVRRYIENGNEEEEIDISAIRRKLVDLEKDRIEINKKVEDYLSKLKY